MSILSLDKQYICPGQTHPISRAVHLSRLAAFYPGCRDCPFRSETGQLPKPTVERLQNTERRVQRKSLFTAEGVRGVYLNELSRGKAGEMASALASLLWDAAPLLGRAEADGRGRRRAAPSLVVGHDERPSSPDIVTGVVAALRRMGCQVIDVAVTTRPAFWFAVDHLKSTGGLFVTGGGCGPSWTGLEFVVQEALPVSEERGVSHEDCGSTTSELRTSKSTLALGQLEQRIGRTNSRPTRQGGLHRPFQAYIPYEASLWKHFHALRPLTVCCGTPSRLLDRTLARIFETLPCRLVPVDIPQRARNPLDPDDADAQRVGAAVCRHHADLGVLIDDDGGRCSFFDDEGRLVAPRIVTLLIARLLLSEHPHAPVVVEDPEDPIHDSLRSAIEQAGGRCAAGGTTLAETSHAMRDHAAVFSGGDSGRFWFRESFPTCDAIVTLAKMLDVLSRSDATFSEVTHSVRINRR